MLETDGAGIERMVPELHQGELIYGEHVVRYLFARQFVKGKRVLDVACGSGYGSSILASSGAAGVVGADISVDAIEDCRRLHSRPGLEFLVADAQNLPLPGGSVDVAVSFETLEHVPQPELFISEMHRVLSEEGLLIISTPNSSLYPEGNPYHMREFTVQEFDALLEGFKYRRILGQDNWIASAIVTEDVVGSEGLINAHPAQLGAATARPPSQSLYLIALCSNGRIASPEPYAIISRVSETDTWLNEMERRDQQLAGERAGSSERILRLNASLDQSQRERDELSRKLATIQSSTALKTIVWLRRSVERFPAARWIYLSLAGLMKKRLSKGE